MNIFKKLAIMTIPLALVGCSAEWFTPSPYLSVEREFTPKNQSDDDIFEKGVLCATQKISAPRVGQLFAYQSEKTHTYVINFVVAEYLHTNFTFNVKNGKTRLTLDNFIRHQPPYEPQPGSDFYQNQVNYYSPIVNQFLDDFKSCILN